MKKLFLLIAVVAMILPSCKKINETLESLDNRVTELENTTIPTINEQIAKINTSIVDLEEADVELKNYITALQGTAAELQKSIDATNIKIDEIKVTLQSEISTAKAEVLAQLEALRTEMNNELVQISSTIAILQAKDVEIEQKIADLKSYVDNELKNTEDWATATFSTLEQYNAVCAEIATIKTQIENLNKSISELETRLNTKIATDIASAVKGLQSELADVVTEITNTYTSAISTAKEEITAAYTVAIQSAISALESSMKQWVGEQLANYYTIAQVDAKISALQRQIQANGTEELINEINTLKSSLQSMKSELTTAYQKAITDAINTNNGVINNKIANEIASVNQRITNEIKTFNSRLDDIESRLDALEDKVDDLMNRKLEITFEDTEDIAILAGSSCKVNYTVTSSESEIHIATIAQNGWKASVTKSTEKTGYITVYAPNPLTTEPIIVLVSDANTTIMRSLTFVNGVISIETRTYALTNEATTLSIGVSTNLNYGINIPSSAVDWISLQNITSRAIMRNDIINLNIEENSSTYNREAVLSLVSNDEEVGEITISQQGIIIANNQLIYTSSDGATITPYQVTGFNANIISNSCVNGRGIITFDNDITTIGEYAFYNCANLTSIRMPKSVNKIKDYAFYNSGLTNIEMPNNVTEIATFAFCSTDIVNLIIPDSVTEIGMDAFRYCSSLTSVTIGNSVTSIGEGAFRYCDSLTSVTIPDNVTSIGYDAFLSCNSLTSITIPDSVTSIGEGAFRYCRSLTSVTIPDSITSIGSYAFDYCTSLTSITIPDSVTSIGDSTFYGCTSLKRVDISDLSAWCKISFGSSSANPLCNGAKLYLNGSELTNMTIPSDITEIKQYAFSGYTSLTSITIPDSVTTIGGYAFYSCTSLTSVTIGNGVTTIGSYAFSDCTSLRQVYCKPTTPPAICYGNGSNGFYMSFTLNSNMKIYVPRNSYDDYMQYSSWQTGIYQTNWYIYEQYIGPYDFE